MQEAGGGFYAKTGQWAATKEEAQEIDRTVARNKAWVRSLQGKEQWLNRPKLEGGKIGARASGSSNTVVKPSPSQGQRLPNWVKAGACFSVLPAVKPG